MATQSHALVLTFLHPFSLFPESSVCHKDSLSTISHIFTFSYRLSCSFLSLSSHPLFLVALHCLPLPHDLSPSLTTSFLLSPACTLTSFTCLLFLEQSLFCTPSLPHSSSLCYSHSHPLMSPLLLPCVCCCFCLPYFSSTLFLTFFLLFSPTLFNISLTHALSCSLACACLCFFAHFLSQALALSHDGAFLAPLPYPL